MAAASPAYAFEQERTHTIVPALPVDQSDVSIAHNDCIDMVGATCASSSTLIQVGDDRPLFTRVERQVIDTGNRDPLTRIAQGSQLARLRRLLFGIEAPLPFGDRRLEALRRLTLALRRHGRSADAEIVIALQEGVTPQQVEHLRASGQRNQGSLSWTKLI